MALTATAVKAAKAKRKQYRLYDERGLYLQVSPSGGKYWRFKYRVDGRERVLALGVFPEIGLADARDRREAARRLVARGIDPGKQRRARREARAKARQDSFEVIGREWAQRQRWTERHRDRVLARLKNDIFPQIGSDAITAIDAPQILAALRRVEARGAVDTAHRERGYTSQIFRYAIATGRAVHDPAADLKGALTATKTKHFASITDPRQIGPLLVAIDGYQGTEVVRLALRLMPYVFLRPGNFRSAEWSQIDFRGREWRIPEDRMKRPAPHIIPLAPQVVDMLEYLYKLSGHRSEYLFPSLRTISRPLSENTLNAALRRLGYSKFDLTGHGFRHMASTLLHEQGFNSDAVERQLAHLDRNETRATYNYAEYLQERRIMMQSWADYLDELREIAATTD